MLRSIRRAFTAITLALFFGLVASSTTSAVTGGDWRAGGIIDDAIFYQGNDESTTSIQNFLNYRVPVCDIWGSQPYAGTTRAAYAASRGQSTPFTCLKDYSMTVQGKVADNYCSGIGPGVKSAARIIYEVSVVCGISSKALIAILEKEQGLISDDWPWNIQYRGAMGYGCPDTAPCDAEYYGFFNQVYNAARQYKVYAANIDSYRYKPYQNNYIYWHPSLGGCGGNTVYIENRSTAGLYNYTPYQPNQAALSNLYGSGDSCSAYGNRNFWRLYNDWFGSTQPRNYAAQAVGQSLFPVIKQGESSRVYISFKNIGIQPWYDEAAAWVNNKLPARLGTTTPPNRNSVFGSSWRFGPSRPAEYFAAVYEADGTTLAANQHVAQPGQIAKFEFSFTIPNNIPAGSYQEDFIPLIEGSGAMNSTGAWLGLRVEQTNYSAQPISQSSYPTIIRGQTSRAYFSYKNTGNTAWYDEASAWSAGKKPVRLATDTPPNRNSVFGSSWRFGPSRPAEYFAAVYEADGTTLAANQHVAQPGQIAKFEFSFTTSGAIAPGYYAEGFRPIVEGWGAMNPTGTWIGVTVQPESYSAQPISQSSYPTIIRGQTSRAYFSYKNTGNTAWYDEASAWSAGKKPVRLATDTPPNRNSVFGSSWRFGPSRPAEYFAAVYEADGTTLAANQHVAQPGQIAKFEFSFTTSGAIAPGYYAEGFRPIVEGWGAMNPTGTWIGVTVQ